MSKRTSVEIENRVIDFYLDGKSSKEIGEIFNISKRTCLNILKRNNIEIRDISYCQRIHSKFSLDENFFDVINTEEKAYWLGFFSADGSIHSGNRLEIGLNIDDIEHLEKFKKSIKSNHEIKIKNKFCKKKNKTYYGCRIMFRSKPMKLALNKVGIFKNKTYNLKPYDEINSDLVRHYLRGLIDGDGCLSLKHHQIGLTGTYEICGFFRDKICEEINWFKPEILNDSRGADYHIVFGGAQLTKKIISYLYNDCSIFLNRKLEIAEKMMIFETKKHSSYSIVFNATGLNLKTEDYKNFRNSLKKNLYLKYSIEKLSFKEMSGICSYKPSTCYYLVREYCLENNIPFKRTKS